MDCAIRIKDLDMRRLSWIVQVGQKCNHKCSYKRKAEGNFTTEEEKAM